MFKKTFAAAALAAFALPALAQADEAQTFVRDGVSYTYTTSVENGHTVISGTAGGTATPFRLVVSGSRIKGKFGDSPVTFSMREVKASSAFALK